MNKMIQHRVLYIQWCKFKKNTDHSLSYCTLFKQVNNTNMCWIFCLLLLKDLSQWKGKNSVLTPTIYGQRPAWPIWMERTGSKDKPLSKRSWKIDQTNPAIETIMACRFLPCCFSLTTHQLCSVPHFGKIVSSIAVHLTFDKFCCHWKSWKFIL